MASLHTAGSAHCVRCIPCARTVHAAASRRDVVNATALASVLSTAPQPPAARAVLIDEKVASTVYAASAASVAAIEDYTDDQQGVRQEGVGTGIIWDRFGHVVTNYHCIAKLARDDTGTKVRCTQPAPALCLHCARRGGASLAADNLLPMACCAAATHCIAVSWLVRRSPCAYRRL